MPILSSFLQQQNHHCPVCGKPFSTPSQVLKHLNNPNCQCYAGKKQSLNSQQPSSPEASHNDNVFEVDPSDMDVDPHIPMPFLETPTPGSDYTVEMHPNVPLNYGPGQSFMGIFDSDEHAQHHNTNSFYPWASHQEWELATFLLKSNLSMASIDQFLKLKLVCPH
jgi:hypothetical protein